MEMIKNTYQTMKGQMMHKTFLGASILFPLPYILILIEAIDEVFFFMMHLVLSHFLLLASCFLFLSLYKQGMINVSSTHT
jgi:hypothetical protein